MDLEKRGGEGRRASLLVGRATIELPFRESEYINAQLSLELTTCVV